MVMKEQILGILTCLLALFGCKSESCDVRALCVRDEIGNYIIKWETNPVIKGIAKLYVSDVPDKFDMNILPHQLPSKTDLSVISPPIISSVNISGLPSTIILLKT